MNRKLTLQDFLAILGILIMLLGIFILGKHHDAVMYDLYTLEIRHYMRPVGGGAIFLGAFIMLSPVFLDSNEK